MSKSKTIADVRQHLFDQLERLGDTSTPVDVQRARLIVETAQAIINSAKVEVEAAAVLKGAMTMPFIEGQAEERSAEPLPLPRPSLKAEERALGAGPAADHPWRGLSTVHRLKG